MARSRLKLSHCFAEFLTSKRLTSAASTIKNYETLGRQFQQLFREDPWLDNVTTAHVEKYLTRYDHPPSYNIVLGQMNTVFTWCVKRGYLKRNPAAALDHKPEMKRGAVVKKRIPVDEWEKVLQSAGERHAVERAIVAAGMYLGSRGNELRRIKVGDLERDELGQIVKVRVVRSKQNWEAMVPVSQELAEELELWLVWYREHNGPDLPPNAYLFPPRVPSRFTHNHSNGRFTYGDDPNHPVNMFSEMSPAVHHRIIRKALVDTGHYQKGEGTHTLRRSVAAALYEEDIERGYSEALDTVRTFLGHAQTSTTEGYIGTSFSERKLEERLVGRHMFKRNAAKAADNVVPLGEPRAVTSEQRREGLA